MAGEPRIYRMAPIGNDGAGLADVDCLITALGSDVRGIQIVQSYCQSGLRPRSATVLEFVERANALTGAERDAQHAAFRLPPVSPGVLTASLEEPGQSIEGLKAVGFVDGLVGIDMTLLTRPFLFWLLKYLNRNAPASDVVIYYTEPESYRYSRGTFDSYQATEGPLEVLEVPGFPGRPRSTKASVLTVLLGFDGQLATAIYEDVAPTNLAVVNGFPSYYPKYKDVSLVSNERLVAAAPAVYHAAADNPFETYNTLSHVRTAFPDSFMTIAPLGTKPMALGACLFAIDNDDVRIVYPRAREYAKVTTRSTWRSWRYDIDASRHPGAARSEEHGRGDAPAAKGDRR